MVNILEDLFVLGPSWSWSYDNLIYNYLCSQCQSPLTLWIRTPLRQGVFDTTLFDKVCQWLVAGWWFSRCTLVSSTNKTDKYSWNIVESPNPIGFGKKYVAILYREADLSRSNLRTSWPIHFKFHRVIGIDGLTVSIRYGEISNFHSRVMGLIHQIVGDFSYVVL